MNSSTKTTPVRTLSDLPPSPVLHPQPIIAAHRFEDAELAHITSLIGDMIDRLIAHNDQIPLSPDALTRFHSRSPPGISVYDYLQRIVRYANVERSCLLITLHYIDQICTRLPKFTITSLTVHRFLIAAVTVSSKALCDVFCTNSHYAKVGGIKLAELNMLEREFLSIIDWRLACTRELLQAYYVNLIRTHSSGGFQLAPASPPATETEQDLTSAFSPVSHVATIADSDVHKNEDAEDEEEELTAHVESSYENSTTADEDDIMCDESIISSSDSEDDDREMTVSEPQSGFPIQPHRLPRSPRSPHTVTSPHTHSSSPLTTPRSAAKRSLSISGAMDASDDISNTRPRGRRRLEGHNS
ncbi:hypothetical protein FRC02_007708 [Tulasnella sp. 418]|nr:hypothetical protein FRC02_007708 [Tulasnella sp. 418]